ncbi:hypothetical protein GCM10009595_08330 [Falsarthrobacter nasiphocae]|uniref:DNA-binding GntR family transcriptional regulator n=1 Tax=Falsarthrobacter nasiphocae TaxID=189863 RepID=A0AAE3YFS4_9MICC|nr:DNA-binding GntR family transcriptional regulator [Falsarthrobacter nasiphocae]
MSGQGVALRAHGRSASAVGRAVDDDGVAAGLSKSQQAYEWIKERIARQEFTPGYRLVLGSVAAELGMSAVPVREAIRRLEAEGLVTFERNVGARVSMVDDSHYRASMEALSILEGSATALAAPRIGPERIAAARELNEQMRAALARFEPRAFTALNHEFHAALFEACPNERLLALVRAEWERLAHLRDSTFSFVPARAAQSVSEHEDILRLIEAGAPAHEIEQACRCHRAATLTAFLAQAHPEHPEPSRAEPGLAEPGRPAPAGAAAGHSGPTGHAAQTSLTTPETPAEAARLARP